MAERRLHRRALLHALGVGTAGVLAGCPGAGNRSSTETTAAPDGRPTASAPRDRTVPAATPPTNRQEAEGPPSPGETGGGERSRPVVRLAPDEGQPADRFGESVALSGDTALVGAPGDLGRKRRHMGSAYLYRRDGGRWRLGTLLAADGGGPGNRFGSAVALDGDVALVGAHRETTAGAPLRGGAYAFEREGDRWQIRTQLVPESGSAKDLFGAAVAVSEDVALVGAQGDTDPDGRTTGAAYLFERSDAAWVERARLTAGDVNPGEQFARTIAVSRQTAMVGAPRTGRDIGAVYVYDRRDGPWLLRDRLTPTGGNRNLYFGSALALAENVALVGAPNDMDERGRRTGVAYLFERRDGSWERQAVLAPPSAREDDYVGESVALTGRTALVSAPFDARAESSEYGSLYVYDLSGDAPTQRDVFSTADSDADGEFGLSVALSESAALAGAPSESDPNGPDAGAAYAFRR